ncbi:hypothetical protein ABZZ79_29240 [Streptomyces sp. NPDC006458]|uniref:hypothetical protein n=1 Tax=Streptomyces sp. NPDC006458 TaxID=3154302 RepID=UPI0033AF4185
MMAEALTGAAVSAVTAVMESVAPHLWWLGLLASAAAVLGAAGWVRWHLRGRAALRCRTAVDLVPARDFDPSAAEIERHAARLARVPAEAGWLPRRAAGVRIRHWSVDGNLATRLEGPTRSADLLRLPSFPLVEVLETDRGASGEAQPIRFAVIDPLAKSGGGENR